MSEIQLMQGDCLEKMKAIPDKSIDMILCDLPFIGCFCLYTNRHFIEIELDEDYFNIAKERIDKAVEDKWKRDE